LEDIATQLAATSAVVMNVDSADNESGSYQAGARESSTERIQHELHLASLRQVDIQTRIRAIRDALIALINVFGPGILSDQRDDSPACGQYLSRTQVASVCVQILRTSETQWLTAHQILELIRKNAPLTLADSKNPGTSLSNILRGLGPAVQSRAGEGNKMVWRWVGEKCGDPQSSQTAAIMRGFPPESIAVGADYIEGEPRSESGILHIES
jgi:hypothetical protein